MRKNAFSYERGQKKLEYRDSRKRQFAHKHLPTPEPIGGSAFMGDAKARQVISTIFKGSATQKMLE